ILVTAAIVYFIFGVIRYVIAGDADKKEEAKSVIVRGVIGLFFILSIWGVIVMLQNTLGLKNMQVTDQHLPGVLDNNY
ncbi:MAG: pilin, partial [Candidatus Pacebacteria bacterium]|nr:pilin [Candidatus Paceibacterota bacterium]